MKHEWPPISFFGSVDDAEVWTVSINPSSREFTDQKGLELRGRDQRFALVRDFPGCSVRGDLSEAHVAQVVEMQHTVFDRAPYRNYFNRLGKFLLTVYNAEAPDTLAPFMAGIQRDGRMLKFCHMDIVKCATSQPWSGLRNPDRQLLVNNCSPYLEEQLTSAPSVRTLLINGKTVSDVLLPALRRIGLNSSTRTVQLATTSAQVTHGNLTMGAKDIRVVAWTSNVVNQLLRLADVSILASAVRRAVT